MEFNSRLNALNNWYGAGLKRTKAKVISGKSNAKLTHVQNVHKDTRQNADFVKIKAEKDNRTTEQGTWESNGTLMTGAKTVHSAQEGKQTGGDLATQELDHKNSAETHASQRI